ncbi:MAG: isoprenyl transferase [Bacteroidia bacterium]|nr:isoprenyl transferase [Bacteroidia bacterium]
MSSKEKINTSKLPVHIAVIMDGNGRWARMQGQERVFGHQNGVESVRETAEAAAELGVKYLTLYAFSTENWNRPSEEVTALMSLLVHTIHQETPTLNKNKIRLNAIGNLSALPGDCYKELQQAMAETATNDRMMLTLALSYSSRWEIIHAVNKIAEKVKSGVLTPGKITEADFENELNTHGIPDPELLIRTSGESRISNYLLWQIAYAELYFTETLWPDFRKEDLYKAILDYQGRERRFGKISEQLTP